MWDKPGVHWLLESFGTQQLFRWIGHHCLVQAHAISMAKRGTFFGGMPKGF